MSNLTQEHYYTEAGSEFNQRVRGVLTPVVQELVEYQCAQSNGTEYPNVRS